jgi:hypothetical protein
MSSLTEHVLGLGEESMCMRDELGEDEAQASAYNSQCRVDQAEEVCSLVRGSLCDPEEVVRDDLMAIRKLVHVQLAHIPCPNALGGARGDPVPAGGSHSTRLSSAAAQTWLVLVGIQAIYALRPIL